MPELYPAAPPADPVVSREDPLDDPVVLTTPENVRIVYTLAGLGSRGMAFLIDFGIRYGVVLVALVVATIVTEAQLFLLFEWTGPLVAAVILVFFLAQTAYHALFEILWDGQSPGKRLMRIRVIQEGGYPVTLLGALVRNLLRFADVLPLGYAVGLVSGFLTPRHQRLGDLVAGTIVVREPDARAALDAVALLAPPSGATDPPAEWQERHGLRLGKEEAEIVHRFLARSAELDPVARDHIADRLLTEILAARGIQERPPDLPAAQEALAQLLRSPGAGGGRG